MPKIKNYKYRHFDAIINYSTKYSRFELSFKDSDLANFANPEGYSNYVITGDSEAQIIEKFQTLVNSYLKQGIKKEKFLVVNIASSYKCSDDIFRAGGISSILKLQWCTVTKMSTNDKEFYKNDKDDYFYAKDSIVIPWTEKREAFLSQMTTSLQEMATKVQDFFKEEDLAKRIDTKKILLLTKE